MNPILDPNRAKSTATLLRNAKGAAVLSFFLMWVGTVSLWNSSRPGAWGDALLIGLWTAQYFAITSMLAANQRLVMIQRLIERRDQRGITEFARVPAVVHFLALLIFHDPRKLYSRAHQRR